MLCNCFNLPCIFKKPEHFHYINSAIPKESVGCTVKWNVMDSLSLCTVHMDSDGVSGAG